MRKPNSRLVKAIVNRATIAAITISSIGYVFLPQTVHAAPLTERKVTISSSAVGTVAAGQSVSYAFSFKIPSTTVLKSFRAQVCDAADPAVACTSPTGFAITSASNLASQPTNFGDATGWTGDSTTSSVFALRFKKTGNTAAPSNVNPATFTFNSITNPTATNTAFYLRLTTYSDDSYTTAVDSGVVAVSTANRITVRAYVPETLTFCIYQGGTCAVPTGNNTVDLGTLSTATVKTGTSKMDCSSNATNGYAITYSGDTLTQGIRNIDAIGATRAASAPGTEQFGFNAVANTTATSTPAVGANPTGTAPIGRTISVADGGQYGDPDFFAFDTASVTTPVAFADSGNPAQPTNTTTWTLSWIANILGITAAGEYTTTVTFVATATF